MSLNSVVARFLLIPTLASLTWLYNYPAIQQCAFPSVGVWGGRSDGPPPFRLLALADPQLEGDTSLPDPNAPQFPSLTRLQQHINNHGLSGVTESWPYIHEAITLDLPKVLQGYRKQLDLFGNDYYLAHVYRLMKWWTNPTHVVVLGDLLGSQWIDDGEFNRRADRFWNIVFKGAERVPAEITSSNAKIEILGHDKSWKNRIIAVAGNHDIGYAGDIDSNRIRRFENTFGHVNWDMAFVMPNASSQDVPLADLDMFETPRITMMVLNTMNLDEPAKDSQLRDETLMFVGDLSKKANDYNDYKKRELRLLLTHIPLHKEAGVCVDAPLINYFDPEQGGGIREQNHLKPDTSRQLLNVVLAGWDPQAVVLNGHDHEGCDTDHHRLWINYNPEAPVKISPKYETERHRADIVPEVREITVRSMMGSYGGTAGLFSAWYHHGTDYDQYRTDGRWLYEYSSCSLGVQHIWWAVHVLAIIESMLCIVSVLLFVRRRLVISGTKQKRE